MIWLLIIIGLIVVVPILFLAWLGIQLILFFKDFRLY